MPNPTPSLTPLEAASDAMRRSVLGGEEVGEDVCEEVCETVSARESADLSDFIEVSGLLEYDPAAISRIYAGAPQRLIRRVWQTLVPIGLYLLGVGFDWLTRRLADQDYARARAKEAADLVASLGPAFIKAGQALSTRPDIIPPL
ncbi:MAG: AarF/ABC1/UbiB kinase family protein, partial [Vulcanococcus sp.]